MIIRCFKAVTFLFFIMVFFSGAISAGESNSTKSSEYISNKLLVKFYPEVTDEKKATIRKELGAELIKCLKEIGVEVWKLPVSLSIDDAIVKLKEEASVEYSEPDYKYKPLSTPDDSEFKNIWHPINSGKEANKTLSAFSGCEWVHLSGTSTSAPIVARVRGCILSYVPDTSYSEAKEIITNSMHRIDDLGGKIIRTGNVVYNALDMVAEVKAASTTNNDSSSSSDNGGSCFIATAAYGSYDHPDVILLRNVRDRYLLKSDLGRRFVSVYYSLSPPVARFVKRHEILRYASKAALFPIVTFSRLLIGFGLMFIVTVASIGYLLPFSLFFIMAREKKEDEI